MGGHSPYSTTRQASILWKFHVLSFRLQKILHPTPDNVEYGLIGKKFFYQSRVEKVELTSIANAR